MKRLYLVCLSFIFLALTSCTPTTLYKSITVEKNADGSTKKIETESVSQFIQTHKKLTLEKITLE